MNDNLIRAAIEQVLRKRGYEPESRRKDIAFHLTDWLADLDAWYSFCESPDQIDSESAEEIIVNFLMHVPNHAAAASKLMLDIPVTDVFDVGAIDDDS